MYYIVCDLFVDAGDDVTRPRHHYLSFLNMFSPFGIESVLAHIFSSLTLLLRANCRLCGFNMLPLKKSVRSLTL